MKANKKNKLILFAIIITIIIIFTMILIIKKINTNRENNSEVVSNTQTNTNNKDNEENEEEKQLIEKLKSSSEAERIQTYLGKYFKYIEKKEYDKAYNLLYPAFKENYFPTIEDYEKYINEQGYAELLTIDYDDIHMQGEYYIITVKIGDLLNNVDILKKEKTFIIKENGYNDYYISLKK